MLSCVIIEIHKGKCFGIIGLLHGNNSNEKIDNE